MTTDRMPLLCGKPGLARRIQLALVILAFGILYAPEWLELVHTWWGTSGRDDYGHGFVIVIISSYLVWRKRGELAQLSIHPNLAVGVPVTVLAALLLIAGRLTATALLGELSLLVMIAGLLLLLAGATYFRALIFPLLFLLFMIPILDEPLEAIHWPFQLLAADIGAGLIRLVGIPVYREAQYIYLPRITLEVAEVCSGVRYLIAVLALGIPLAYLTLPTWRRRVALVTFAVTVAIAANGLRVAMIGVWVQYLGTGIIHGPYHTLQGLFVSWIGFIAIFVGMWFLSRGSKALPPPAGAGGPSCGRLVPSVYQESGWKL